MPARLPIRSASTRIRSPVPARGRRESETAGRSRDDRSPGGLLRPAQSVRSRSHDGGRRQAEDARREDRSAADARDSRRPRRRRNSSASSASSIDAPRSRRDERAAGSARQRRRSPDSVSPRRPERTRHSSVGARDYQASTSARPGVMLKPDYVPGLKESGHEKDQHRPATPAKYRPSSITSDPAKSSAAKPEVKPAAGVAPAVQPTAPAPAPAAAPYPAAGFPSAAAIAEAAQKGPRGLAGLVPNLPTALTAYAGFQFLTKNADKAKDWTDWFKDLQDAPEEMQGLSAKTTTARDTITQIQETLKARPDLLEGETGKALKDQIEDQIKSTDKALGKMNKMLADLTHQGAKEGDGNIVAGIEKYWNSYRYKEEWEGKLKAADAELQKELAALSTLMVNVYSRAIMKPAPPAVAAATTSPPPPAPIPTSSSIPFAATAAATASAPAPTAPAVPTVQTVAPTVSERAQMTQPNVVEPPKVPHLANPPLQETPLPPPSLVAAAAGATSPSPTGTPPVRHPSTADVAVPISSASSTPPGRHSSIAGAAVADIAAPKPTVAKSPAVLQDISPLSSPPPRPSSVAREEENIAIPPLHPRISSGAVPPLAAAYMSTPPPSAPSTGGAPLDARAQIPTKDSVESLVSDLEPQDVLLDAAWEGDIDAVALALRRAPATSCDLKGHTPLHLACERDHLAVAIMLLDRGADVHARADGGRMALHMAARFASAEMVEMLLERGKADPNARTAEGRTPLHYAASAARDGNEERRDVLRVLRDWGADPTIPDRKKKLPRDVAQARDHWDAAATLRRAETRWEEDHKQNWLQRHGFSR